MQPLNLKRLGYLPCFIACAIMALASGCASGGFKITRQYAGFVNKQMIVVRVILYLLTGVVFAVTMLIDMVVFNTMDFWEGRVSAGDYHFESGDRIYVARHEILPGSKLKRSTVKVFNKDKKLAQEIVLSEAATGEIEMMVDGKLRARVRNVSELPVASIFDVNGSLVNEAVVPDDGALTSTGLVAHVR